MAETPPPAPPAARRGPAAWFGRRGSDRRRLVRNGAWEWSSFVAYAAVMFFLSPFLVARLGDGAYGIWELVLAITGYFGLADLGVRPAVVQAVARHDARGELDALNRCTNTACAIFAAAGAAILLIAVPLAFWIPAGFGMAAADRLPATLALLLVAGEQALALPFQAWSAVVIGKQRHDLLGRARLVVLALRTAGIIAVLLAGWGLVALAAVHALASVLEIVWFTRIAFRLEPALRFAPRLVDRAAARSLLRFGGWATVVLLALQVTWATDAVVIGGALGAVHVAWFAIGAKLALVAREVLRVGMRVIEPASSAYDARDDHASLQALVRHGARFMVLLAVPVVAYLVVVGPAFLERWMGPGYGASSGSVLGWMALGVLPAMASAPLVSIHYGTGRMRPLALAMILEAAGNLVLSLLLVGPLGIVGVAIGTAVPAWLVHGLLLPWLACTRHGIALPSFLVRTWGGPLLAGAATVGVLHALVSGRDALGWPALIALAVLAVGVHALAVALLRRILPPVWGRGPLLGETVAPGSAS